MYKYYIDKYKILYRKNELLHVTDRGGTCFLINLNSNTVDMVENWRKYETEIVYISHVSNYITETNYQATPSYNR